MTKRLKSFSDDEGLTFTPYPKGVISDTDTEEKRREVKNITIVVKRLMEELHLIAFVVLFR